MNYIDICPPAVVQAIEAADFRSAASAGLIGWVEMQADRACALATIEAVAGRLTTESDLTVVDLFCNAVATYAEMLDAEQKAIIRAAFRRLPYNPAISFNYFMALRLAGIDVRSDLRGRVAVDWSFASPRRDAQTWDHYLYLASLNEPGAWEALADKIAATTSGNDVALLLESLAELPNPEVDEIIGRYVTDKRTADGVEGPAMSIAKNAELLLEMRKM